MGTKVESMSRPAVTRRLHSTIATSTTSYMGITTIDTGFAQPTASYLLNTSSGAILVGAGIPKSSTRFIRALQAEKIEPRDVKYVVLTDASLPHITGTATLLQLCPAARVIAPPHAASLLCNPKELQAAVRHLYGNHAESIFGGLDRTVDESAIMVLETTSQELDLD